MGRKIRVGVIFGGRSGEHEVSLMSANSVIKAIDREKFDVVPIGITRQGKWLLAGDVMKALRSGIAEADGTPVALLGDPTRKGLMRLPGGAAEPGTAEPGARAIGESVDAVFPVLHGTFGEDGTVQGLLELAGIPYVGAGVLASALGMDKALMKTVFAQKGIPIAKYRVFMRHLWERDEEPILDEIEGEFGYPCFIKPANLGSSVGISKAHNREELIGALDLAAHYDRKIIVEEFVDAREVECSVLGNDDPVASVPGEIVPCNEFYDYKAKYIDGKSGLIIPAELSPETTREVQRLAVEAFQAIDCAGMARVDFFVTRGEGKVMVNEINTIPGFTAISMYPKLWEASGVSYQDLITRLIELAIERYRDKERSVTSYDIG